MTLFVRYSTNMARTCGSKFSTNNIANVLTKRWNMLRSLHDDIIQTMCAFILASVCISIHLHTCPYIFIPPGSPSQDYFSLACSTEVHTWKIMPFSNEYELQGCIVVNRISVRLHVDCIPYRRETKEKEKCEIHLRMFLAPWFSLLSLKPLKFRNSQLTRTKILILPDTNTCE